MQVYLDLIFIINFSYDFLLLLTVTILLKRNIKLKRIFLGSIIGAFSLLIFFININNIELLIFKFFISLMIILTSFGYKNITYFIRNVLYFYLVSIILAGSLYLLELETSFKKEGFVFYFNKISNHFLILMILSPIVLYFYIKSIYDLKRNFHYYYKLDIYLNGSLLKLNAFLDTGNKLKDPFFNKPIMIINESSLKGNNIKDYFLVPIDTINNHSLIKCFSVDKIVIDNKEISKKVLIGLSPKKINMEGIDCIFGTEILEG